MEITILDYSPTGRVMHIRQRDATICCAQDLCRSAIKLLWARLSLQFRPTIANNSTSTFSFGKIPSKGTGGCPLAVTACWATGRRRCFLTLPIRLRLLNGVGKWSTQIPTVITLLRKWAVAISPRRVSAGPPTFRIYR